MYKIVLLLLVAACDVGSVLTNTGAGSPDGGGGGGGADGGGGGGGAALTITVTTTPVGGTYAPRNVVAVWIENGGTFVKTIDRWANARKQHLVAWTTAAGAADADAVSGATRADHATPLSITWNLLNRQNAVVPDGTYTVRMELTDLNANTAAQNNQGTFTFVKGAAPQSQTGLSNGGFTNVSINFTP